MQKATKELVEKYITALYEIHEDGSISVDGGVDLNYKDLVEIPFQFRIVTGDFNCSHNRLTSLEGSPQSVGGDFDCYDNQLTSSKGAPQSVGGDFDCYRNQLTSLKGSPQSVGGYFDCSDNQLTSLEGAPQSVGGHFNCRWNNLNFTIKDYISRYNLEVFEDGYIVYKRVSYDFKTQEGTKNETLWLPGTTVEVPFWNVEEECGQGKFHACFDKAHCDNFRDVAGDKYIKIKVRAEDMYVFPNPCYLEKIAFRRGFVIEEIA